MAGIDVFNNNAFGTFSLTGAFNRMPFKPQRLGMMNIFEPRPVRTITIGIEERNNALALVPTSQRGQELDEDSVEKPNIRDFRTVRIAKGDNVNADEIQDIRAFGTESELAQVQQELARRGQSIRDDLELTHEHMRLGAVQGIVLDADGSTEIRNWFTEWSISQPAEIDFDLDNANPASGVVRKKCNEVRRAMQRGAAGSWTPQTTIHALCGDAFWDDLTAHKEVRETFLNTQQASDLRDGNVFETFRYGGITWENYQGTDDNSTVAIGTDKATFFPVNAPGVFQVAYSPAEFMPWVNTPGQSLYSLIIPDMKRQAYVRLEMYSYPLHICTRPQMLQRAKRT